MKTTHNCILPETKLDAAVSGHHFLQTVLDLIYREITTLGLAEFCLYLVHKYGHSINPVMEGDISLFTEEKFFYFCFKFSLGITQISSTPPLSFSYIRGRTFHVILYSSIQCHPRLLNPTAQ